MANDSSEFEGLTENELRIISEEIVDTRAWPLFKKIVGLRRQAIAGQLLNMYTDKGDQVVNRSQGKAEGQKELVEYLSAINKYVKAQEAKAQNK